MFYQCPKCGVSFYSTNDTSPECFNCGHNFYHYDAHSIVSALEHIADAINNLADVFRLTPLAPVAADAEQQQATGDGIDRAAEHDG